MLQCTDGRIRHTVPECVPSQCFTASPRRICKVTCHAAVLLRILSSRLAPTVHATNGSSTYEEKLDETDSVDCESADVGHRDVSCRIHCMRRGKDALNVDSNAYLGIVDSSVDDHPSMVEWQYNVQIHF